MPQSFASVHLHVVFSTKNRRPWLAPALLPRLFEYMGGTLRSKKCALRNAGGVADHVHLQISMGREIPIADLVRDVKANSSRWVHDSHTDLADFAWQAGYGAFAVSFSQIEIVAGYLARQEVHHRTHTFQDEFRDLLRRHELEWDESHVWD